MSNNATMSLLAEMREARVCYESRYIEFINNRRYHYKYAFCFYEGEDGKYYDPRIRSRFADNFLSYPVGNKKEVLKLLKKIREDKKYNDLCLMFFVDRDYDNSMIGHDGDLYETPCYSIENLYIGEECVKQILKSEFNLNVIEPDYIQCLNDYKQRESEFNECMLEFNALSYLRRQNSDANSDFAFGSVKTSQLTQIHIHEVKKADKYDEIICKIKEVLNFNDSEIEGAMIILKEKGDFTTNFRGKNQLDFFVSFIRELKELHNNGQYFSKRYNKVHINITSNRLSELSQYACTPSTLVEFIDNHWEKYEELTSMV